jgi:hypothetical protein
MNKLLVVLMLAVMCGAQEKPKLKGNNILDESLPIVWNG